MKNERERKNEELQKLKELHNETITAKRASQEDELRQERETHRENLQKVKEKHEQELLTLKLSLENERGVKLQQDRETVAAITESKVIVNVFSLQTCIIFCCQCLFI